MIKHLKGLEINTIYDFDNAFSINELLCKFWEKIEETINISNESIDILNWVKEQGLADEVQTLINQLVADGTIEQMINVDKIEELRTLINTQYTELLAKHNNEVLTLTNDVHTFKEEITNKITVAQKDISNEKKKEQLLIRKNNPSKLSKYILPTGFNWNGVPIDIYTDGYKYETSLSASDYKNTGGKTIYVNTTIGDNSKDGLTEANAVKNVETAFVRCSDGDTIYILDDEGTFIKRASFLNGRKIDKSINIIAKNKVIISDGNIVDWINENGVYKATRSGVNRIVDYNNNFPYEYIKKSTLTECQLEKGTFYTDNTTVWVNTLDSNSPNEKLLIILAVSTALIDYDCTNSNVKVYLENLVLYGGASGVVNVNNTASYNTPEFYAKNCEFAYNTYARKSAVIVWGAKFAILENCIVHDSVRDGFSYQALNGTAPNIVEINCISYDNGKNCYTGEENSYNGSTLHDGCKAIRINGVYYNNMGGNVADVNNGTQSINLGCVAYDSKATTTDGYNSNFNAQQNGAEMWLENCISFGSAWDLYRSGGTKLYVHNTIYDTINTEGNIGELIEY